MPSCIMVERETANKDINIDRKQVYLDVPEGQTRFDFGITLGNRMVGHDRNNV